MKMAKSYKIIILLSAIMMCLISAFSLMGFTSAKAENTALASRYFDGGILDIKDGKVVSQLSEGETLKIKNKLVVDDLSIVMQIPTAVQKLNVKLTASSFDVNGNMKVDGEEVTFDKEITVSKIINGSDASTILNFGVEDNFITLNGTKIQTENYYKVENIDKTAVSVEFELLHLIDGIDSTEIAIVSIDQKASDTTGDYKQEFNLTNDGKLVKEAKPRVSIDKKLFVYSESLNAYVLKKASCTLYTVSTKLYSVTGSSKAVRLNNLDTRPGSYADGDGETGANSITFSEETNPKKISFNLAQGVDSANMYFQACIDNNVVLETYDVNVFNKETYKDNAPQYKDYDQSAVDSFQNALKNATMDDGHSVPLGKRITIPSFENFIFDDTTGYSSLTMTYHYITPQKDNQTSSTTSSIALDSVGDYKLYATARDEYGNSVDSPFFYDVQSKDYMKKVDGKFESISQADMLADTEYAEYNYFIPIFTFTIADDAPISVLANQQDAGFIGVKYVATGFTITEYGCSKNYSLWFNPSLSATGATDENGDLVESGWVEILPITKASEEGANGYTYQELLDIGYDGTLTFTPDKIGSYVITCKLISDKSYRSANASSMIKVAGEPTVVEPANYWVEDNLASIIFLGVGTVCLIALLVVLFHKPKNEVDKND